MVYNTVHWEIFEQIPPQSGPHADRKATSEKTGRSMGLSPAGGCDGGGVISGCGDLHLPPPEHIRTVYYNQAHD